MYSTSSHATSRTSDPGWSSTSNTVRQPAGTCSDTLAGSTPASERGDVESLVREKVTRPRDRLDAAIAVDRTDTDEADATVGGRDTLGTAFGELLSNAIRRTDSDHSRVTVTVETTPTPGITNVRVSVSGVKCATLVGSRANRDGEKTTALSLEKIVCLLRKRFDYLFDETDNFDYLTIVGHLFCVPPFYVTAPLHVLFDDPARFVE